MPRIRLQTTIHAPVGRCFDLSRSIDLHTQSTARTGEQAIAGKTSGLIGLGETVTWRARHFGIWQTLTSRITDYQYPTYFCDDMVKGAFKSLHHEHHFKTEGTATVMTDIFDFEAPMGWLGTLVSRLVLKRYMEDFLRERNAMIKSCAESDQWKALLEA